MTTIAESNDIDSLSLSMEDCLSSMESHRLASNCDNPNTPVNKTAWIQLACGYGQPDWPVAPAAPAGLAAGPERACFGCSYHAACRFRRSGMLGKQTLQAKPSLQSVCITNNETPEALVSRHVLNAKVRRHTKPSSAAPSRDLARTPAVWGLQRNGPALQHRLDSREHVRQFPSEAPAILDKPATTYTKGGDAKCLRFLGVLKNYIPLEWILKLESTRDVKHWASRPSGIGSKE